jgi:hypothetical protein
VPTEPQGCPELGILTIFVWLWLKHFWYISWLPHSNSDLDIVERNITECWGHNVFNSNCLFLLILVWMWPNLYLSTGILKIGDEDPLKDKNIYNFYTQHLMLFVLWKQQYVLEVLDQLIGIWPCLYLSHSHICIWLGLPIPSYGGREAQRVVQSGLFTVQQWCWVLSWCIYMEPCLTDQCLFALSTCHNKCAKIHSKCT